MKNTITSASFPYAGAAITMFAALIIVVASLTLAPSAGLAQTTIKSPWTAFQQRDGLLSNNVWAVMVDGSSVWFGTDAGISRFDGAWHTYRSGYELPGGQVKALAGTGNTGGIWAGTDTGKILRWSGEQWAEVAATAYPVQALHQIGADLWVGTGDGLFTWNGDRLGPVTRFAAQSVTALSVYDGTVWVGTTTGLWTYRDQTWSVATSQEGLPADEVTDLWTDPDGRTWVGTSAGLAWQEPGSTAWMADTSHPYQIQALAGDGQGTVWAGTTGNGALKVIDNGALIIAYSGEEGLETPYVQAVDLDSAGSVWFGTAAGVFRYDDNTWISEEGDSVVFPGINNINALLAPEKDALWIGTSGAGVRYKLGIGWATSETYFTTLNSQLPGDIVLALAQDSQDGIWAGTTQGAVRFRFGRWETPFPLQQLPSPTVNALLPDGDLVWIGTDAGLASYDLTTRTLNIEPFLGQFRVKALEMDSTGRLWVGTQRAGIIVRVPPDRWSQYLHDPHVSDSLAGNSIVALAADRDLPGAMWVGVAETGVSHWDGQRWTTYNSATGLPSNLVYEVYTDPVNHDLWIGSEGGATRYDGLTWETFGGQNNLLSAAIYAIYRTPDGKYWFGGKNGLTYYRPEQIPPWIRIGSAAGALSLFDGVSATVEESQPATVHLAAGDLHTPQSALKILYRLAGPGQDEQWQVTSSLSLYLPTYLEAGSYTLEVQARDQAFNYSRPARLDLLVITPPPTVHIPFLGAIRSDYFITLAIATLIGLAGFGYMSLEIVQNWRQAREAIARGYNPYISGEPVRREDMFFGRHALLQRIVDTLHNNSIMIHGERRIGKTTLLHQLVKRLREIDDPEYWFAPIYIDLEGTNQESFFHVLIEDIVQGILSLPEAGTYLRPRLDNLLFERVPHAAYTDREFSRDLRQAIDALRTYGAEKWPDKQLRMILLMDEMDVISSYDRIVQQRLRRIFMREFSATVGAVVAGIQISKEWDRVESPWYNLFNEIELTPFDQEQARELLEKPVEGVYRYDPEALEFILAHSSGRPYRLQQFGLESINHMLADRRHHVTLRDVQEAYQQLQVNETDDSLGLVPVPADTASADEGQPHPQPIDAAD